LRKLIQNAVHQHLTSADFKATTNFTKAGKKKVHYAQ